MRRERGRITPALVLVGLAAAFAASTSVFNATYAQQAEVDARLTNGADVTVTAAPGTSLSADTQQRVAGVTGVKSVEPLFHRYAYVGADLQDMFGVRASTIVNAGQLQDAYFQGGTATNVIGQLAAHSDGILVSAETVKDYQLQPGDHLKLRVEDRRSHALIPVTFSYVGIVSEFPTAPRDSFMVVNSDYLASSTGDNSPSTLLVDTGTSSPPAVAAMVAKVVGTSALVQDIGTTRRVVGSSLTAVDLGGLTRVELGFALVLAGGATGLLLLLGIVERRRAFAIAAALGARSRQLGAFIWSEVAFVASGGALIGAVLGWLLSHMLVSVLTGVFDPPPAHIAIPWVYLVTVALVAVVTMVIAAGAGIRMLARSPISILRDL
jgi:putative ABC transport system permease protein